VSRETSLVRPVTSAGEVERAAARIGVGLGLTTAEKLAGFADSLSSRGVGLGVISASDAATALERHVVDSLRAVRAVQASARTAYDLGSGGGLPGIPVAAALPELHVTLVETRRLRAAW